MHMETAIPELYCVNTIHCTCNIGLNFTYLLLTYLHIHVSISHPNDATYGYIWLHGINTTTTRRDHEYVQPVEYFKSTALSNGLWSFGNNWLNVYYMYVVSLNSFRMTCQFSLLWIRVVLSCSWKYEFLKYMYIKDSYHNRHSFVYKCFTWEMFVSISCCPLTIKWKYLHLLWTLDPWNFCQWSSCQRTEKMDEVLAEWCTVQETTTFTTMYGQL